MAKANSRVQNLDAVRGRYTYWTLPNAAHTTYRGADVANSAESRDIFGMSDYLPNMLLVDDCIARGASLGLMIRAARGLGKMIIHDRAIEDYRQCGALLENMDVIALVGCRIASAVDAVLDNGSNGGRGVRLGNNISREIIQNCDFFSRQGWLSATENIVYQSCLRLYFYSDTMANMFCGAGAAVVTNAVGVPLIGENNLIYQPTSTPPQTDDAPLVIRPGHCLCRHRQRRGSDRRAQQRGTDPDQTRSRGAE